MSTSKTRGSIPKIGITFNLTNPKKEVSSVRVIVTNRGDVYRKSIGMSVRTAQWHGGRCDDAAKNAGLRKIRTALEYELDGISTEYQIKSALAHIYNGIWNDTPIPEEEAGIHKTFMEYFKEWAERPSGAMRQKMNTYNNVLRLMGPCDWGDINERWYTKFVMLCDKENYSRNNTGIMVSRVKTVLHEGRKLGYHDSDFWQEMHKFKSPVENIALTKDECERIINCDTNNQMERKAIDLFILGYKTGARFSDISRLTVDAVHDGRIQFIQQKTAEKVEIPASPMVVEVLARNGGKAPKLAQQHYNKAIKDVARKAGVTDIVEIVKSRGASFVHEYKQKCDLISSHTSRRSCITQLHFSGVPLKDVMTISGHKKLSTLENYIKTTREDSIRRLSENDFFK